MTFDRFYNLCKGKLIDYDHVSGPQCVDLVKVYLNYYFGIKPGAWGNAVDYFTSFEQRKPLVEKFEKIQNGNIQQYILYGLIFLVLSLVGVVIFG